MMYTDLPFSQACENNKTAILHYLRQAFAHCSNVLEIGSGTGQHAVYFASHLTDLTWQASDQAMHLASLTERLRRAALANLPAPMLLDISHSTLPQQQFDGVFTANTLHIMPWPLVEQFFNHLTNLTKPAATLCIYGPFNYHGNYTSASNQAFDSSLKSRDTAMGIRAFEQVELLAQRQGFALVQDCDMPANNRLLWFKKTD